MLRTSKLLAAAAGVLLPAISVYACGGSEDPKSFDVIANECVQAIELLCKRACQCGSSHGACAAVDEGQTAATTYPNVDECKKAHLTPFLHKNCEGGGHPNVDYADCRADIDEDDCVDTSVGEAIERPKSCNPQLSPVDGGKDTGGGD